nr:hypothetical protein 1 [Totiviridae sp.]
MKTNLKTETVGTLCLKPQTLSRLLAPLFVSGVWQSIGIGLDCTVETTSSMLNRQRGFMLAAQPSDGTSQSIPAATITSAKVHDPTVSPGVSSNTSTTQLLDQVQKQETANMESVRGPQPSPIASSNPIGAPALHTSQNTTQDNSSMQCVINQAIPPSLKTATDGTGGISLDQTVRTETA